MSPSSNDQALLFVVHGQAVPPDATRGGPTGTGRPLGERTRVLQRVQMGALRGGAPQRLSARPGQDAVVLHIADGPSLVLHPLTAKALMQAQAPGVRAGADETAIPAQLGWPGLAPRGATRGGLGSALISAVEVITGIALEPAARLTARRLARRFDEQVTPGVHPLSAEAMATPLKGHAPLQRIPAAPADAPLLVLLHGTFSDTHGTFGKLWLHHPQRVRDLFGHYGGRVYALDHPTLSASPIDNALMLAQALPDGARVHLLTHSRGGLVGEVLARVCAHPELDEAALAPFKAEGHRDQLRALRALAAELKGRDIRVERLLRVACPARGTLLASGRLDAYVSVLKWTLELAGVPVAPQLLDFLGEVASHRTDPQELPGLQAMTPLSPLVQWLHASDAHGPLPGQLRVVAGDIEGDSVRAWVKTLLADAFYWTDNDLVVQTRSMYGGTPRAANGAQAGASFVLERGGNVTHFAYFSHPRTAQAVCDGLTQEQPAGFRAIGPLSWAGQSETGVRAAPARGEAREAARRPAVILLPGILGSHLAVHRERVWLSLRIIGGLDRLAWQGHAGEALPDGPIGAFYDKLARRLSETHELIPFGFDWRRPIEEEARRLANCMERALAAREDSGQPVRLLAHSMGGVLARTVQLERPDVWERWAQRPGARLLMLGTPNGGSFAPMQVLSGDDNFGNALVAFGLPFQDHRARQIMAAMPGFLQLQAGLLDPSLGLASSQRWTELAEQDMNTLERALTWHSEGPQRSIYRWGIPPQPVLDQARALRERLDRQAREALPGFRDRLVMVVGRSRFTPAGYEIDDDEGLVYLDRPEGGDGRVTQESALLPGVRAWRLDCAHGDLPKAERAFDAYLDLLERGETTRLEPVVATARGSPAEPTEAPTVRSRPSRQARAIDEPLLDVHALLDPENLHPAQPPAPGSAPLAITVHNRDLVFVGQTLLIGHYASSRLTGTEAVADRLLGGVPSASLAAGLYPEAPGTHQIFVNRHENPARPLSLPQPPWVVVAGLGAEGKLGSAQLVHTICQATIAWAMRLAEDPAGPPAQFELTSTLIASGGSGIHVGTSAQALAHGVREANARLAQGQWPQVSHLHINELYLDRAAEAWSALQMLAGAAQGHFRLSPLIESGPGALRRPLDSGYRGTGYDFVSAIVHDDRHGEPVITYTLDTKRARSEVRQQPLQQRLIHDLVTTASNHLTRDPQLGRTLFQLLVPQDLESSLEGTSELVLELDDRSATIPWELLDAPLDRRRDPKEPWAIRNRLVRRLRTEVFRSQVRDATIEDHALVVGEPASGPTPLAELPGARAEARAVATALLGPKGMAENEVRRLIADEDGHKPGAADIINALFERPYRVLHIAGHGEPAAARDSGPTRPALRGVVLSDGAFIGPREIEAMRVVPELVFLNCCHLAADKSASLAGADNRSELAAGLAQQLIRIGVRCVVAAGWAVADGAAAAFATTFYQRLLDGQRFMDAVQAGRVEAYRTDGTSNTWAAYQCYGDPDWVWQRAGSEADNAPLPVEQRYASVASPSALVVALESLIAQCNTGNLAPAEMVVRLRHLQQRFQEPWGGSGAIAEAFGLAWREADQLDEAVHWFEQAVRADDGSAGIRAAEQLANVLARRAWYRLRSASRSPDEMSEALWQARVDVARALDSLQALVALADSVERASLQGGTFKRLAQIERLAHERGLTPDDAACAKALACMAEHYQRAETLALRQGQDEAFHPAMNLLAADVVRGHPLDPRRVAQASDSLRRQHARAPNFWSAVADAELLILQALDQNQLAQAQAGIDAMLVDLHAHAGSSWLWKSPTDQLEFLLGLAGAGQRGTAHREAAALLLQRLRRYAGAAAGAA
jgi:hypothetical protein